ncbi:hypothetical protein VOLCADRAFT_121534 [Volvox carteri f. nagariensis]|uniref:Uncharacterized protein n=1 Tax=Volvox carteri f. nagariensis TaxID=3068 RepID=D8UCV6_VOLCA|nr:uncharacterized protein VOLCADRAFT_121534 [Volvox carteri f. nagariensis]EFJ42456.1 hypothetical protein VOLCADRAFT_121534 [Volvox carteri f. nagariensis]|eukprot:XP_002956519.1 hypothetical protein VOLCADRAFT_121534 [Volvox carteri f. nagariensis]
MGTKVKSKIQRLLKQLDQDDESLPGDNAAALRVTSTEEEAEDLAALASARRAAAAIEHTPGHLTISSVDAASESTATLNGISTGDSPPEDSESLAPSLSSLDTTPLPQRPNRTPNGHRKSYMAAGHAERVAVLERKVMSLMAENRSLHTTFSEAMARKNAEVSELQAHLAGTVNELSLRHQELEAAAPLLRMRLEDFRSQLSDLRVRIAVHEVLTESKSEAATLHTALTAARETAVRAEEAAARARAEAARAGAALAERDSDLALLESAMVSAQLSAAKGAMYDELRAKLDATVAENQRLAVVEATFKKLESQAAQDRATATQKEHTFEMLMMDKAYLTKQASTAAPETPPSPPLVDFLADQQRKLEAELELREKKINELSRQKSEMFEKLMTAETLKGRHEDVRLQKELAALQERTHADLEKIRVETAEAYEREARLLRELRDSAQEEALRAKAALAELQALHEKTGLAHAEVARRLEQQVVALQTELKQKTFELSHFKVVVAEKEQLLGRTNMQLCALLSPPVDLALLRQERDALSREVQHMSGRLAAAHDMLRLASQPHAFLLEELEAVKLRATQAENRVAALQVPLGCEMLGGMGCECGPLLAQGAVDSMAVEKKYITMENRQVALTARSNEVEALTAERDALRSDLDGLLAQRQALEGMKAVVVKALAGGLPQVQQAAAMAAAARKPAPGFSSTTIIGEGGLAPAPPLPTPMELSRRQSQQQQQQQRR